jgi:hypothetical protein
MAGLRLVLRAVAPVFFVVAALHLTLGVGADVLLGARVPSSALADPALDSQNRFYGASLAIYGVLLWVCASDVARYARVLSATMLVFLGAGLARVVSMAVRGLPPPPVLVLFAAEVLLPPLLLVWLARATRASARPTAGGGRG